MMRKELFLFALISLMMIPTVVLAKFDFENIKIEKNITDFVAGSMQYETVSFKYDKDNMGSLVVKFNVTETIGNYPVWMGDFKVRAVLNSTTLYPASPNSASSISQMNCDEVKNGTFYCFNMSSDLTKKDKASYIVLPKSINNLTIYVNSNPALTPSTYRFDTELFTDPNVPKIKDPIEEFVEANNSTLFNASDVDTMLWITTNESKDLLLDLTGYDFVWGQLFPPADNPIPIKFVSIETNSSISSAEIRIYYNQTDIASSVDENSLKMYYYNDTDADSNNWKWELINSEVNTVENYVSANINHFSLFGIFGSPQKEVVEVPVPVYGSGGVVYQNVTQNVTIEKEKPIYLEKEVPAKPVCGNKICEASETQENCCLDCGCPTGYECKNNTCVGIASKLLPTVIPTGIGLLTGFATFITSTIGFTAIFVLLIGIAIFILWSKRGHEPIKESITDPEPEQITEQKSEPAEENVEPQNQQPTEPISDSIQESTDPIHEPSKETVDSTNELPEPIQEPANEQPTEQKSEPAEENVEPENETENMKKEKEN